MLSCTSAFSLTVHMHAGDHEVQERSPWRWSYPRLMSMLGTGKAVCTFNHWAVFFFFFLSRVSIGCPRWPSTHSVVWTNFALPFPASNSCPALLILKRAFPHQGTGLSVDLSVWWHLNNDSRTWLFPKAYRVVAKAIRKEKRAAEHWKGAGPARHGNPFH